MSRRFVTVLGSVTMALICPIGVGGVRAATVVYFDDLETATAWTTNPNGTDTATGGRWERGDPRGTRALVPYQLANTVSGTYDLVTGADDGYSISSHDVDGGVTSIQSPPITLPSSGPLTLSFSWYFSHSNNSSTADFLRVRVVGTATSQVLQQQGTADTYRGAAWTTATADISAHAGQTVRVLIEAADAAEISLVEAAVDDVTITRS